MPIEIKKKEGESLGSFLYRFNKRIRQSGILKEAKKRRFHSRNVNRNKRRASALYRIQKKKQVARQRKYGHS
ncbi:MAG: 30S ribosomal protein S21 [Patescibacteria group bacterium]|nr:30S ribosomal protein S21 [Patescibacteria group bacterium]